MERICDHTWEWGDYIPEVWEDWLADEQGFLMVGELEGRVVALSKITVQADDQMWLEGMRVAPDYRGQGVAGAFLAYSLAYCQAQGARVVRLSTWSHNAAVHKIATRCGMVRVATCVLVMAEPLCDGSELSFLTPDQAGQVQALLRDGPALAAMHGLCRTDWTWQELSPQLIAQFLHNSQIAAHHSPGGDLAALAGLAFDAGHNELWCTFLDGAPEGVAALATGIRAHAARRVAQAVQISVPNLDWLHEALLTAGYVPGDWEGELWIFEWHANAASDAGPEVRFGD
jgi:GNAT superfamily N-acetyltransferase